MASITIAVEGPHDEAICRRLFHLFGHVVRTVHVTRGKNRLDEKLGGFNNAARFSPWLILRDLNGDAVCPPDLIRQLLPDPAPHMMLRIAVCAVESWLLADPANLAPFLGVRLADIPLTPEAIARPKRALVDAAARSRYPRIKRDIVPRPNSGVEVGPGYTGRLLEFVTTRWDPEHAATRSDSLTRLINTLARL